MDLPAERVPDARRHRASLGLLDAAAEISVDAMAVLGPLLSDNHECVADLSARLAEKQRAAAELTRHYLGPGRAGSDNRVEVRGRDRRHASSSCSASSPRPRGRASSNSIPPLTGTATTALHDFCRLSASEAADVPSTVHDARLTEQQRAELRMLGTGAKDVAIARALGVSTRTVTRVIGELSTLLGAGSRFQADVRAARLGWLD